MSTRVYTLPVDQTRWNVEGGAQTVFTWEYDEGRDRLLTLYEKGKTKQWNTTWRRTRVSCTKSSTWPTRSTRT